MSYAKLQRTHLVNVCLPLQNTFRLLLLVRTVTKTEIQNVTPGYTSQFTSSTLCQIDKLEHKTLPRSTHMKL